MNSEAKNTNDFLISAGKIPGLKVFRNNCGCLKNEAGKWTRFGIGNDIGGSDFIGIYKGRFCAFEIKADADNTDAERLAKQENFINIIIANGGLAGFVRRPADIIPILNGWGCTRLADYPLERLT